MFSRSAANTVRFPKNCGNVICMLAEMDSSQLERSQKILQIHFLSHFVIKYLSWSSKPNLR